MKFKPSDEWLLQAEYDYKTAAAMFKAGRYIYAVFMCHLSIEKALKGLYAERLKKNPPKIHDLVFLSEKINLAIPAELNDFIDELNDLSVPTRYPDELKRLLKEYNKGRTGKTLKQTKELLSWLRGKSKD